MFALEDTKTMCTTNLEIYPGKQPDGSYYQINSPEHVVKRSSYWKNR